MGRILALLFFVLLAAAPGCHLFADTAEEPKWVDYELSGGPPMRDLMDACVWAVISAKFPPGDRDEVNHTITSGWDVQLHPYSYKGTRSQAIVEVEPGDGPGKYDLHVRVRVQKNAEVHKPLEPAEAKWEDSHEHEARARLVLEQVLARVKPRGSRR